MNADLYQLIRQYQQRVAQAVQLLRIELGLPLPDDATSWADAGLPLQGDFGHVLQYRYRLQGDRVDFEDETGWLSWRFDALGDWRGLDSERLADYIEFNRLDPLYADAGQLTAALDEALCRGEVESRGGLYYLRAGGHPGERVL